MLGFLILIGAAFLTFVVCGFLLVWWPRKEVVRRAWANPKPIESASRRVSMPPEMAAPYTECGKRPDRETERNRVEALMRSRRHQRAIQHFRLRYREAEEGQFEYVRLDPYEAEQLLELIELVDGEA